MSSADSLSAKNQKPRFLRGFWFLMGARVRTLQPRSGSRVRQSAGLPIWTPCPKGEDQGWSESIPLSARQKNHQQAGQTLQLNCLHSETVPKADQSLKR
jgi:hypothetical protein